MKKCFTLYFKVLFMKKYQEPIEQLKDIHSMMERSSRFISLSGLSGISAGIIALIGAAFAWFLPGDRQYYHSGIACGGPVTGHWKIIIIDALMVLVLAILSGIWFTTRKARRNGLKVWDNTTRRLVVSLAIPLAAGGIFCAALLYHHSFYLIAPATLIFYGLSLLNASKYTYNEVRILGISEIILGLIGSFLNGYGLLFWTFGFGILHIFYGAMMFVRYELNQPKK